MGRSAGHVSGQPRPSIEESVGRALIGAQSKLDLMEVPDALAMLVEFYGRLTSVLDYEVESSRAVVSRAKNHISRTVGRPVARVLSLGRALYFRKASIDLVRRSSVVKNFEFGPMLIVKRFPPDEDNPRALGKALIAACLTARKAVAALEENPDPLYQLVGAECHHCLQLVIKTLKEHKILGICRRPECGRPFVVSTPTKSYCSVEVEHRNCAALEKARRNYARTKLAG